MHPLDTDFDNKDIVIECIKERFVELLKLEVNLAHMEQIKKIIKFILDNCDKNQKEKLFEIIKMRIDDEIRYDIFISIK